jgi:ribosome-associated protein
VPPVSEDDLSKSARKREAKRVKTLGTQLAELSDEACAALNLPPALLQALADFRSIRSNEAKRRQGQYIGRLMRTIDVAAVEHALAERTRATGQSRFTHHETEQWRQRLIDTDEALAEYLNRYPSTDRQQLRAMIRSVRNRPEDPAAFRTLFRFLRDNVANHAAEHAADHDAEPPAASVPPTVT